MITVISYGPPVVERDTVPTNNLLFDDSVPFEFDDGADLILE